MDNESRTTDVDASTPSPRALNGPSPTASIVQQKFAAAARDNYNLSNSTIPFQPGRYFFYGTLMDPDILQLILGLPQPPVLQRGMLLRVRMKLWGIYPALMLGGDSEVHGMVYNLETEEELQRLQRYETSAYTPSPCRIKLEEGGEFVPGWTFCWNGPSGSRELEDGVFDSARFQNYFKPGMMGKQGDAGKN